MCVIVPVQSGLYLSGTPHIVFIYFGCANSWSGLYCVSHLRIHCLSPVEVVGWLVSLLEVSVPGMVFVFSGRPGVNSKLQSSIELF